VKPAPAPRRLSAEETRFRADIRALGISSSEDAKGPGAFGDSRGLRALETALQVGGPGFHAYVCGLEGTDRLERVAALVRPILGTERLIWDWAYVHHFSDPNRPRAIRMRPGQGRRLRVELEALLRGLREDLPKAFREEAFESEKRSVVEEFEKRAGEHREELVEIGKRAGFALVFAPDGNIAAVPLVDGHPVTSEEEFQKLGAARIEMLEKGRKALSGDLRDFVTRQLDERRRLDEEIRRIEREFAARIVRNRIRELAKRFDNERLARHLDQMGEHILDHLDPFRGEVQQPSLPLALLASEETDPFALYDVNIAVDNGETDAPPVIVVDSPTYKNLFGLIDRTADRFGRITTDFRRIQAGALLEADGGVVVLQAEDALIEPFVWRILRRALRSRRVEIEAYDPFVGFTPAALRPEPIHVETKVVMVGPRWLFEMLLGADAEFPDLFKVLADFSPVVEREADTTRALCQRVRSVAEAEGLPCFEAGALEALVELAVREAGDRCKIDLGSERVMDAAREAAARARRAGRSEIGREEVQEAVRDRVHRLDRVEQLIRQAIARGHLLVEVEGRRTGQVNALSVSELGGHAFGRPARVTAAVGMGAEGVVSIDRETKLSGATHDKGVLILQSFLRDRFAYSRPLSLMASVVFEQSYGYVEGDSASLAELLAILSRVGGFGLRQDLAVTGSVNQRGEVQAVGGVNEKIEGFFDCCRLMGANGAQGVVFPAANLDHLILREDLVEAVERGEFHLYPVRTVDEALEVLTGEAAGSPVEPDTLNYVVDRALQELSERLRSFVQG
jgi:ATP-dependent Lon protease